MGPPSLPHSLGMCASLLCALPAVDFVLGGKNQPLLKMYDQWRGWADPKVCCDYSFHVAVTWWNDQVREDMGTLVRERGTLPAQSHMHRQYTVAGLNGNIQIEYIMT